jgi:PTH1 family peptidyl-tRNA hydrolase
LGTPLDLIVGLGNPGAEYLTTRHNAGFWFLDLLAREHGGRFTGSRKLAGDTAEVRIADRQIRLLKPMTFMNLSGQSVGAAVRYYKIPLDHVLVAYDEIDLPPGRAQLKFGGGTAGHNGVTSVVEHVGPEFWRLRFGVGHPRDAAPSAGRGDVRNHVLQRASGDEEEEILGAIAAAVAAMPVLLELGAERAKNQLHAHKPSESSGGERAE